MDHEDHLAQATLALTDDQMASICAEYNTMSAALNALYSEQKAMLSTNVEVHSQVLMTGQVCISPPGKPCCTLSGHRMPQR